MKSKVEVAVEFVRTAKDTAGRSLSTKQYREFLEELLADAEGWKMELEEGEE